MGKMYEAKVLTDDQGNSIGFTDHTGYFYPIDRGQVKPGQFHCDVPLSALEVGECILRLDQLVKEARSLNFSLDTPKQQQFERLALRVSELEGIIESARAAFAGEIVEE